MKYPTHSGMKRQIYNIQYKYWIINYKDLIFSYVYHKSLVPSSISLQCLHYFPKPFSNFYCNNCLLTNIHVTTRTTTNAKYKASLFLFILKINLFQNCLTEPKICLKDWIAQKYFNNFMYWHPIIFNDKCISLPYLLLTLIDMPNIKYIFIWNLDRDYHLDSQLKELIINFFHLSFFCFATSIITVGSLVKRLRLFYLHLALLQVEL